MGGTAKRPGSVQVHRPACTAIGSMQRCVGEHDGARRASGVHGARPTTRRASDHAEWMTIGQMTTIMSGTRSRNRCQRGL